MKQMWDERYRVAEYVYGKKPNTFLKEQLAQLSPGCILFPGEGEGRNAVYAASIGWDVTAFDTSAEGRKKALALAREKGTQIQFDVSSYLEFEYMKRRFDAVGLFFTHQPPEMRKVFHSKIAGALKPGGTLIMEAFHKNQISNNTGGPANPDLLFSEEELENDFSGLNIVSLNVVSRNLSEGIFHRGIAVVVQLIATKRL